MLKIIKSRILLPVVVAGAGVVCMAGDVNPSSGLFLAPTPVLSRSLFLDATAAHGVMAIVGERGQVLIAETGGPWQLVTAPVDVTLTSVYFHDGMLGWAAGHDAVIMKTTDGGRHWRQVYSDPDRDSPVLDIWFADSTHGIAIGAYGLYLVTTNGGESWIKDELHIINSNAQEGPVTNTAGTARFEADEQFDRHLNSIAAAESGKLYIAAEGGHLYRSDDSGLSWRELPSPYHGSWFGVLPVGQESLLVFGLRGHLFRSDDAGNSWQAIATHTNETLTAGVRLRDGSIVITGMDGVVLCSRDQGRTFAFKELPSRHGYAAVLEAGPDRLTFAGDHGLETWHRNDIGLGHD